MDGIHDLGGKLGYGAVQVTQTEPAFHHDWEARLFGMVRCMSRPADWNLDKFRNTRELETPVRYLTRPYFDQWYKVYACMMLGSGVATIEELASGQSDAPVTGLPAPQSREGARAFFNRFSPGFDRPYDKAPAFTIGDRVKTNLLGKTGHTRLPAYARGQTGTITAHHGAHILPDDSVHDIETAQPLYTVRFALSDLFPERTDSVDSVHLDLWESYLVAIS